MSALRALLARVRGIFGNNHPGRLEQEIKEHLDLIAADFVRGGMTEAEARDAARREFGNVALMQQEYREQKGLPLLENLWLDLKFAVRSLRRNPSYTAACAATLAVGLGAMIAVLCVVSALLWKPLPYPHPERLVVLQETDPRGEPWSFSEPDLLDLQERSASIAAVAGWRRALSALTGAGNPETVQSAAVTPSSFAVFGIDPIISQTFQGQAFRNSPNDVVISRGLWKRKWRMNPGVIGQSIALDGENYTIVGVADPPADLLHGADVLLPLLPKATESRTAHEVEVAGRLRTGVDPGQAQAELNTIAASIARENPRTNAGWGMRAVPILQYVIGPRTGRTVWMISAAVALFWLLSCGNVAGLQMARSIARKREMGTRLALGASRARLFAQTLTESAVLATLGSILGVVLAQYGVDLIRALAAESLPRLALIHVDAPMIGAALGGIFISTVLCTIFSGRAPEFRGERGVSRRDRGHHVLIVVQVALASILLLGASLLLHSFVRLQAVDPGFDAERILTVHVTLPTAAYDDVRKTAFFRDVTERLTRLPQVQSVAATNVSPFSGAGTANRFRLEAEAMSPEFHSAAWRAVTPAFFPALGIPLKRGRLFSDADTSAAPQVVIISESMARKFWPGQDPIGKRLLWGKSGSPKTIIGIVGDLRDLAVDAPPVPTMFRPFTQLSEAPMTLVIRTHGDPATASSGVRREIWALDRNVALAFQPLSRAMSDSIMRPRVSLVAFTVFAAIAMLTAAFGLYATISYRVNQRHQEIGIRLALGCPAPAVRWDVQKRFLALVAGGLAIGLPVAYALSTLIASLLYETRPAQASSYVSVLLVFGAVALAASFGPARRASRMDPASAIRYE